MLGLRNLFANSSARQTFTVVINKVTIQKEKADNVA